MQTCSDCGLESHDLDNHECAPRGTFLILRTDGHGKTREVEVLAGYTESQAEAARSLFESIRWNSDTVYSVKRLV